MKPKYTVYTSPATGKALLFKNVSSFQTMLFHESTSFFLLSPSEAHPGGETGRGPGGGYYLLEEIPNPSHHPFPDYSSLALGELGLHCYRIIRMVIKVKLSLLPIFFFNLSPASPKNRYVRENKPYIVRENSLS